MDDKLIYYDEKQITNSVDSNYGLKRLNTLSINQLIKHDLQSYAPSLPEELWIWWIDFYLFLIPALKTALRYITTYKKHGRYALLSQTKVYIILHKSLSFTFVLPLKFLYFFY